MQITYKYQILKMKKITIITIISFLSLGVLAQSKKNSNERILTCEYCGKDFKQKKVTYQVMGQRITLWEGGAKHCELNYYQNRHVNPMFESDKSKYCSRKCACESGEQ